MPLICRRRKSQRGEAIIEFALITSLFLLPLFFGVVALGLNLGRNIQVTQITRDLGHMYSQGVDFASLGGQVSGGSTNLVTQIAPSYNLSSSGNTVFIFSKLSTVYQADCTAAGVSSCTNAGQTVFLQRVVIGNSSIRASNLGTPTGMDANGNIAPSTYLTTPAEVSSAFASILSGAGLTQQQGDVAYVVEGYTQTPDVSVFGLGVNGIYAISIF